MKKTILVLLFGMILNNVQGQNPKITFTDSIKFVSGTNSFVLKNMGTYIKFIVYGDWDSIYSTQWGGFTSGSTAASDWTLADPSLYPNSVDYNVYVGQTTGTEKFDVAGNIDASNFSTTYGTNTNVGEYSGNGASMGAGNSLLGYYTGYALTGGYNTFLGGYAGRYSTTGENNLFAGYRAGTSNTTGYENTFLGYEAGVNNTAGYSNIGIGYQAGGGNATGDNNIYIGNNSGDGCTGGNNTFVGYMTGYSNVSGSGNLFLGYQAGYSETGSNKLYIDNSNTASPLLYGDFAANTLRLNGAFNISGSNSVVSIAATGDTLATLENTKALLNDTADVLRAEWSTLHYGEVDTFGTPVANRIAYFETTTKIGGSSNFSYNDTSLKFISSIGTYNVLIGNETPASIASGSQYNVCIGRQSGYNITTGDYNVYIGGLNNTSTTSSSNVSIGVYAGNANTGSNNVFIGDHCGNNGGAYSNNVFIGYYTGQGKAWSNTLAIDISNTATPLVHGDFTADTLRINGSLTVKDSLIVDKYIKADSIYTLKAAAWADYVLEKNYPAPKIELKEQFIKQYGHLPGLKSGAELDAIAAKNGGYLSNIEYNNRLEGSIKEIEELTLMVIDLYKQIDELKKQK
jgi:hypothetical protein